MKGYIIIPGCSDLNRGDQALLWETKRIAEECGYCGKYYFVADEKEPVKQSMDAGMDVLFPILDHPSRFDRTNNNIHYGVLLKIKWGIVALADFLKSVLLLVPVIRNLIVKCLKREKRETYKHIANADAVFVKGGGFIHSYGSITDLYYIYYVLFHLFLAHSLKKTVFVMPNSFGPFRTIGVKWLVKKALKKCKLIYARESISCDMLKKDTGIEATNMPDLAFFLKTGSNIIKQKGICTDRKKVAITMRPYRFPGCSDQEQKYINYKNCLAGMIEWLYDEGFMPVIVEHTLAVSMHEDDFACIEDVIKNILQDKYILISNKDMNCEQLKGVYKQCDYIIGTRFHSVIFSLSYGIPAIAITYGGNKGNGIMKDIGIEEYAVNIDEIDLETLKKMFTELLSNESDIKQKIFDYIAQANKNRQVMKKELMVYAEG